MTVRATRLTNFASLLSGETKVGRIAPGLYRYTQNDLTFEVAEVTPSSRGLFGWCECHVDGTDLPVASGEKNLRGANTPRDLARLATERSNIDGWRDFLEASRTSIVHDYLTGDPPVLAVPELMTPEDQWTIPGLWTGSMATTFAGFGEAGKSFSALAAGLTVSTGHCFLDGFEAQKTGPVLYLDWEDTGAVFNHRLSQLLKGLKRPPPKTLYHRAEAIPLWRSAAALQRHIFDEGIVAVVVDSVFRARGAEGDSFKPETTIRLYECLTGFGVPCLLIDHKTKDGKSKGPMGTGANLYALRLLWGVTSHPRATKDGMSITLDREKGNNCGPMAAIAWDLVFTEGDTAARFVRRDPSAVAFGIEATNAERLYSTLREAGLAGMTAKDLSERAGVPYASVGTTLKRMEGRVRKDGRVWLARVDHRQEEAFVEPEETPW